MARTSDYLSRSDQGVLNFAKNLIENMEKDGNQERWRITVDTAPLVNATAEYEVAFLKCQSNERTTAYVVRKNRLKDVLVKIIRNIVQGFLSRNEFVIAEDRAELWLPLRDVIPTVIPPPAIPVTGILTFPAKGLVEMTKIQPAGGTRDERAKHGVRIYFGIVGGAVKAIPERPSTGDDLPHSVFTRRKRFRFDFTGESGKEAFFSMRYENSKGEAGPWGHIISAFIP